MMNDKRVNNNMKLVYACKLAVTAWMLLILSLLFIVVAYLTDNQYFMLVPFSLFFTITIVYIVLVTFVKCDNCSKRLLIQGIKPPEYIAENKVWGMIGWSGIVLSVLRNKEFTCMHCGTKYKINHKD